MRAFCGAARFVLLYLKFRSGGCRWRSLPETGITAIRQKYDTTDFSAPRAHESGIMLTKLLELSYHFRYIFCSEQRAAGHENIRTCADTAGTCVMSVHSAVN